MDSSVNFLLVNGQALNDIRDLVGKGVLRKSEEGGRSTNYVLVENP